MAEATARVASSLASATVAATATATVATATSKAAVAIAAALRAVAGNVTDLATLVALLAAAATATHGGTAVLGALARDVSGATAAVARLLGLGRGAFTANVALLAAVVAGWCTLGRALSSAVGRISAWTLSVKAHTAYGCNEERVAAMVMEPNSVLVYGKRAVWCTTTSRVCWLATVGSPRKCAVG